MLPRLSAPHERGDAGALVAVVEDDTAIAEGLALNLKLLGYRSEVIGDGETALAAHRGGRARSRAPRHHACRSAAACGCWSSSGERQNHVPIIVLSARQDESDKVAALSLGADDYITKPFALAELLARVAAVLRRARLGGPAAAPDVERPAVAARALPAVRRRRRRSRGAHGVARASSP